jgi:hypothetical protein
MQDNNPNSFEQVPQDANANPQVSNQGTEAEKTVNPTQEAAPEVDYRTKFSESAKEAQRLFEENKALNARLAEVGTQPQGETPRETLYPGFEQLDEEAQRNMIAYTESIKQRTLNDIYKDPAISYAKQNYNEKKWNDAFSEVATQFPDLTSYKDEFKSKYFRPDKPVDEKILGDLAKIHLFDKSKELGAQEERARANRIDMERPTGGDKTPQASRSSEDWQRMALNPAEFAKHSKEFQADLESGKLKE